MDQKMEFVLKTMQGGNFRALCAEYGIAPKTGYKWKERFLQRGLEGLVEQSRRPQQSPEALREEQVCAVVRLKQRHPSWGPKKIQELYRREHGEAPSESSCKRVLERAGLVEKRRTRPAGAAGRICSEQRGEEANAVWTVDFKGWWYDRSGQRCEPLTVRDEHSRFVLASERLANARTETVWASLEKLFVRHGLPGAIRSDNGAPFASRQAVLGLSKLSSRWVALGINLERSRPGCPQDNGAHERMHRDMSRELERSPGASTQAELDLWRETFNWQRPHEALGMKCPGELYRPSPRRYQGLPTVLTYAGMDTRRILASGSFRWQSASIFLSTALAGWDVGLRPCAEDRWEVYFGPLRLGEMEPSTASFRGTPWQPQKATASHPDLLP